MRPIALYIHFPWCIRKCPYCDFNSHAYTGELPEVAYVKRLLEDLDYDRHLWSGRLITSIFLGGGTPNLFSAKSLSILFDGIRERLSLAEDIEITMEANPGTLEHGDFSDYLQLGINRISLGAQSFQDEQLKRLGRIHESGHIFKAVEAIKKAGIINFNLDLMHGLPNQTPQEALTDLEKALSLNPTHLSWYQLTLEPNTVFYSKPPILPSEDHLAEIELEGRSFLQQKGYHAYEVSAYCQTGFECRHNLTYWQFGDYLGIGAGAHGKITQGTDIIRYWKKQQPKSYLQGPPFIAGQAPITLTERPFEFMLNALRLRKGFTLPEYSLQTKLPPETLTPGIQKGLNQGLLEKNGDRIYTTELGFRFLNETILLFNP